MEEPRIVIEGLEDILARDLDKHTGILGRTKIELQSFREARSYEMRKKSHYRSLIGGGKYKDENLQKAIKDIEVNIRHMRDKMKLSQDKIEHHSLIVDKLTVQLKEQKGNLAYLKQWKKDHGTNN